MSQNLPRFGPPVVIAGLIASLSFSPACQAEEAPVQAEEARSGWLESLLYNPVERTEEGAAALEASAPEAATEALDTALRLNPSSDKARYNAGTAHLLATDKDKAAPLLEAAALSADKALSARAFYNLGNSRLEGQDPDLKGAVEAYKESLRRDPASADAKFNLELALRRLQEQQKKDQQGQDQQKDQQKDQQDEQKKDGGQGQGQGDQQQEKNEQQNKDPQQGQDDKEKQGDNQNKDQQSGKDQEKQPESKPEQQQQALPGQKGESSPLPQFHDLPDMDAQQAAAILEAIENLERNQRRQDAKKALKANASGKKDW